VGMAEALGRYPGREAIDQSAEARRDRIAHVTADEEESRPGREADRERLQDVVGKNRAQDGRDRSQDRRHQREGAVPEEVESRGIVDIGTEERIVPVAQGEWRPCQEPHHLWRVSRTADRVREWPNPGVDEK